jgi:hypothetical protein
VLQGMVQAWNFNQHEAHAAFLLAADEDPTCSRCWWGVAYALGPGVNRCPNMSMYQRVQTPMCSFAIFSHSASRASRCSAARHPSAGGAGCGRAALL